VAQKQEAELGLVSLVGAVSCAVIASELYSDIITGTEHFPLPRPLKAIALIGFSLFVILETNKTRRRFARTLNIA